MSSFSRKVQEQGLTATDVATALTHRAPFPVRSSPIPAPATLQAQERAEGAQRRVVFRRPSAAATPPVVAPEAPAVVTAAPTTSKVEIASNVNVAPKFVRGTNGLESSGVEPAATSSASTTPRPAFNRPVGTSSTVSTTPPQRGMNAARAAFQRPAPLRQNVSKQQEDDDRYKRHKALREKMGEIALVSTLEALGGTSRDKGKWKVEGTNYIFKGQKWQNTLTQTKGMGSVYLVKDALDLSSEVEAIRWLIDKFGDQFGDDIRASADELNAKKEDFRPPENDPSTIESVRRYLVRERGLPNSQITKLIDENKIYSDPMRNCVFISPAAAEVRSTFGTPFKGCCTGSQTDISGFRVMFNKNVSESTVALVEAAIDSLSYNALFPGRFAMSTNGSGRFDLQFKVAREALDNGFKVKAAFDGDWAGDHAAQKLFNAFYTRIVLAHELKVDEETIDEWILDQRITFPIDESPHTAFFNEGWASSKRVFNNERVLIDGKPNIVWFDTGKEAAPTIQVHIDQNLHPSLTRGERLITVSEKGYRHVTEKIGLRRERPVFTKDWNEEMLRLGSAFIQDYERQAQRGFTQGVPQLPDYLEVLRSGTVAEQEAQLRPVLVPMPMDELERLRQSSGTAVAPTTGIPSTTAHAQHEARELTMAATEAPSDGAPRFRRPR